MQRLLAKVRWVVYIGSITNGYCESYYFLGCQQELGIQKNSNNLFLLLRIQRRTSTISGKIECVIINGKLLTRQVANMKKLK
jgi:hypothetical protein